MRKNQKRLLVQLNKLPTIELLHMLRNPLNEFTEEAVAQAETILEKRGATKNLKKILTREYLELTTSSGFEKMTAFLILKTFESIYSEYSHQFNPEEKFFIIPDEDIIDAEIGRKYSGIYRMPLAASRLNQSKLLENTEAVKYEELSAQDLIYQLQEKNLAHGGFIFDYENALEIYEKIVNKDKYEIVWVKTIDEDDESKHPPNSSIIGYDVSGFPHTHHSAIADHLFFTRWIELDSEEKLFEQFYKRLNKYGLFDTIDDACEFFAYYDYYAGMSNSWPDESIRNIIEVWSVDWKFQAKRCC